MENYIIWKDNLAAPITVALNLRAPKYCLRFQSVPHREQSALLLLLLLLMLFKEIITVYCENHTEHINTPCGQNAEF
jgi:hypothetical protein